MLSIGVAATLAFVGGPIGSRLAMASTASGSLPLAVPIISVRTPLSRPPPLVAHPRSPASSTHPPPCGYACVQRARGRFL